MASESEVQKVATTEEVVAAPVGESKRRKVSLESPTGNPTGASTEAAAPPRQPSVTATPERSVSNSSGTPQARVPTPIVWRGEDVTALRQRQNEERLENAQKYGYSISPHISV